MESEADSWNRSQSRGVSHTIRSQPKVILGQVRVGTTVPFMKDSNMRKKKRERGDGFESMAYQLHSRLNTYFVLPVCLQGSRH